MWWLTVRPLGIVRSLVLVWICAVSGVVTASIVAYRRFPDGFTDETPDNTAKASTEPRMRFWRVTTTLLRRRHPSGMTDEIFRQQAEGME